MDGRRNIDISFLNEIEAKKKKELEHEIKLTTKTDYHRSKMEHYNVQELGKNNIEKKICKDLIDAMNQTLLDLRLKKFADSFAITPDDIHLLDKDAYETSFTTSEELDGMPKAYAEYSNVYIDDDRFQSYSEFAFVVAHELSHCCAYKKLETEVDEEGSNQNSLVQDGVMREIDFWGMNEAVTEMLARRIRVEFNKRNKQVSFSNKKKLESERIYERVILPVEAIIRQMSSSQEEEKLLTDELLSNHITGDDSFLKKAELKIPGVTEVLSAMGITYESTLEAAEKLDFQDVVEEIKRIRLIKPDLEETSEKESES